MKNKELIEIAKQASKYAYVPYSGFQVGAALLTNSGKIFSGCNVENASYSQTICAERNAIFQAVAKGEKDFQRIAIFVNSDKIFSPCGACRQVMAEFSPDMEVIIVNNNKVIETTMTELLPLKFELLNEK
ncbi:MAG: cytidine deaminase [Candidatus Cloacimonadota bacterium]|nr:cytidine deaminase [Candidatus Cloacimonadota bacterium]